MPTTDELQAQINALQSQLNSILGMADDDYIHQYSGEEIDAGITAAGKAVRYDLAQSLTAAQQTQARENIAAMQGINSADHPGCYYLLNGSNVEWINPPLALGVEYRTTERFFGKPVYVQLVNFGANTSGANLYVGENVDKIVRHAEYFLGRNPAPAYNGESWPNTMTCVFQAEVATNPSTSKGAAKLFCYTGSGYSGGDTAVIARVAYTKSTD